MGAVEWDTQAMAEVLIPFLNDAQNLEELIISGPSFYDNKNHPLYSPEWIT